MFRFLLKYVEPFSNKDFGMYPQKPIENIGNNIIRLNFFQYSEAVFNFMDDVQEFAILNNLKNYQSVDEKEISDELTNVEIFYKLLSYVRGERFCDRYLLIKLNDESVINLLNILKRRYEIIDKTIEYLISLPKKQEFTIYECFRSGADFDLDSSKESFILLNMFHDERKKRKIRIYFKDDKDHPVGLPWVFRYVK